MVQDLAPKKEMPIHKKENSFEKQRAPQKDSVGEEGDNLKNSDSDKLFAFISIFRPKMGI